MPTYVAVDLGAQSGRVAVGELDGERLTVREAHRFPNVAVQTRGTLHWDVLRLYRDVLDGLRLAATQTGPVTSVSVDSWAVDFALLDRKGNLVQNPVHYRDKRRGRGMNEALTRIPARELYERTGIQLLPINTVFELAALVAEDDPVLAGADTLLLIPDLMHYWLCGSRSSEWTNATTTQCLDARTGGWADDLLDRLDVPTDLLPDVVAPGTPLGALEDDVAEEASLSGAEVVACATHDTGSAVAAVPFRTAGSAFISAGTWSLVGVEVPRAVVSDVSFAANLTNEGGVGGTFRLLRNVTGLWLLHECQAAWARDGHDYSYEELCRLAAEAPALLSFVDPDDPAFVLPGDMPARIGSYCARSGQPVPIEPGAVARCILESLALKHAHAVELVARATEVTPPEIHVVGGGSRNELLCRWTAEASGRPVLAGPEEATLLGNLLVQAIAQRELGSLSEARELVRASLSPVEYEPAQPTVWGEARERFGLLLAGEAMEVHA